MSIYSSDDCTYGSPQDPANYIDFTEINGRNLVDFLKTAVEFDFNKYNTGGLTFEQRFMDENCNSLAEPFLPHTAQICIMEFRKFMAVNANAILRCVYWDSRTEIKPYRIDGITYYESAMHPTVEIDRVWKALILETQTYYDFGYELCGGFIDRRDPSLNPEISKNQIKFYGNTVMNNGYDEYITRFHQLHDLKYIELPDYQFSELRVQSQDIGNLLNTSEISTISENTAFIKTKINPYSIKIIIISPQVFFCY